MLTTKKFSGFAIGIFSGARIAVLTRFVVPAIVYVLLPEALTLLCSKVCWWTFTPSLFWKGAAGNVASMHNSSLDLSWTIVFLPIFPLCQVVRRQGLSIFNNRHGRFPRCLNCSFVIRWYYPCWHHSEWIVYLYCYQHWCLKRGSLSLLTIAALFLSWFTLRWACYTPSHGHTLS